MERSTLTICLFFTALFIGLYIYFFETPSPKFPRKLGKNMVFSFSGDELTEIEIENGKTKKSLRMEKIAGEKWQVEDLSDQSKDQADSHMVGDLVRAISQLSYAEVRDQTAGKIDLAALGLLSPQITLTLRFNSQEIKVLLGGEIPDLKQLFILIDKKVYRVPGYFLRIFQKDFFAFREKHLLQTSIYEMDSFFLIKNSYLMEFRKKDNQWNLTAYPFWKGLLEKQRKMEGQIFGSLPLKKLFLRQMRCREYRDFSPLSNLSAHWISSQTLIREPLLEGPISLFFHQLSSVKARQLIKPTFENIQKLNLTEEKVFAKILLFRAGLLEKALFIWKKDNGHFYSHVQTDNRNVILDLGQGLGNIFDPGINQFRSPGIFSWSGDQIEKFSLHYKGQEHQIVKEKNLWRLKGGPLSFPLDQEITGDFLKKILALQKEQYLNWPKEFQPVMKNSPFWSERISTVPDRLSESGLQDPFLKIQVTRKWGEGRETRILEVGKSPESPLLYGWISQKLPLFTLELSSLKDFFSREVLFFRDRRVAPDLEKIQNLVLTHKKKEIKIHRTSSGEFIPEGKVSAKWEKVEKLLDFLTKKEIISYFKLNNTNREKYFPSPLGEITLLGPSSQKRKIFFGKIFLGRLALREEGMEYGFFVPEEMGTCFRECFKNQ